jgi:transcriptional regulator with XRE-family HTH domain
MRNLLKIKRWQAGMRQYELASRLGCSPPYLSMVENGRIESTEEFKVKAAQIFNVTVEEIFPETVIAEEIFK